MKILIVLICLCCAAPAVADWQATLEATFTGTYTKVCTFDDYDDWTGTGSGDVNTQADMPEIDGTRGMFSYYSYWGAGASSVDWIGPHAGNVWTEGNASNATESKSLRVDIGSTELGPSRLSTFFGDTGAANPESTGYQDVYIFHMVKLQKNNWPTTVVGNDYQYYEAQYPTYITDKSWKFGTANMGCEQEASCDGIPAQPGANYSLYHIIPHIKAYSATESAPGVILEPNCDSELRETVVSSQNILPYLGEWMGVEFRFRNVDESGTLKTYMDVWLYSPDGVATQIITNADYTFTSQPITDLWNNFEFGGNCSSCTFGTGMRSDYYVDDLIIADERIGPTYFNLIKDEDVVDGGIWSFDGKMLNWSTQ